MPSLLQRATREVALHARSVRGAAERPGGAICDDLEALLPSFRAEVEALLEEMVAAGHEPRLFETWRSPERVALLVRRGTGSINSVHPHGIAADIICARKLWNASPLFWRDLCRLSERRGLTAGARWARHDLPHVQAIPVVAQSAFLATREEERDVFCLRWMGPLDVLLAA
jgi:hypothetical protein